MVGMPRSGTKLLRALLTQHPAIRIPDFETEFLPFLVTWVDSEGEPADDEAFGRLHAALRHSPYFSFRSSTGKPFSPAAWRDWCAGKYDPAGLFEGFARYELTAPRGSGIIWGDKSPNYITCIPLLLQLFPQARIVHLIRDVRDYCLSIRKAWGKDMLRAAQRWGHDVLAAHRECEAESDRCVEMRYEALLNSPRTELERVCAFLRIPFTAALAELQKPVENRGDTRGMARIVADNHSKYRAVLPPRQLEAIEALAWTAMNALGYEPCLARSPKQLNRASLAYRRAKDGLNLVLAGARDRNWIRALRFHARHQVVVKQPSAPGR